jgi:2-oxoglutarate dehydrogenase E1 component
MGKARAKQEYAKDTDHTKVLPVLLHGDAAFCGQGVVYETFEMGWWKNFTVGGTLHIIVNNQVGFTTDMKTTRLPSASPYPTDVAKTAMAPIFHVNGDDPEAVVRVLQLAVEYRQTFHKDVVVDIVCYRREGHNEMDEPSFTQPLMYEKIRSHPSTLDLYRKRLKEEGVVTDEEIQRMTDTVMAEYNKLHALSKSYKPTKMDWLSSYWRGYKSPQQLSLIRPTGISVDTINRIGEALTTLPEGFNLHPRLQPLFQKKREMFKTGKGFDWATAEALAFGSLLLEGHLVRLTGQDVERGTFSHRHAVLHDVKTDATYVPLNHLSPTQAPFRIANSPLSEYAALGFELGFSLEHPNSLVLWCALWAMSTSIN